MVGGVGTPCLCLPRELSKIPLHDLAVGEAGNQHHLVPLVGKQVVQLGFACHVHRPMRACRLLEESPAAHSIPRNHVRCLLASFEADAQLIHETGIDHPVLVVGVINVEHLTAWREAR